MSLVGFGGSVNENRARGVRYALVHRDRRRQLAAGALGLPERGRERAQAPMTVGLERTHAEVGISRYAGHR
jgi:hypothetical protein